MNKGRQRILVSYFLRISEEAEWELTLMAKPQLGMNTKPLAFAHSSELRPHSPLERSGFNSLADLRSPVGLLTVNKDSNKKHRCNDTAQITDDVG